MWSWSTCVITKTSMGCAPRLLRTRPRVDERLRLCLTEQEGMTGQPLVRETGTR